MANTEKSKIKNNSEKEDINELAQFREKKKIQNEALKKIVDGFSANEINKKNK